jgi:uncharacterized membrane protein YkvA (DUF1232 family)
LWLKNTSPPHIQILCNAQVAYRMVPRDARSCIFPGFADDLNIYAALKSALKVLVEMRQRLGEDAKFSFNMAKVKIYIPGVTRERARELVLQHID